MRFPLAHWPELPLLPSKDLCRRHRADTPHAETLRLPGITRREVVRLSTLHAAAVGAHAPFTNRVYELIVGEIIAHNSRI